MWYPTWDTYTVCIYHTRGAWHLTLQYSNCCITPLTAHTINYLSSETVGMMLLLISGHLSWARGLAVSSSLASGKLPVVHLELLVFWYYSDAYIQVSGWHKSAHKIDTPLLKTVRRSPTAKKQEDLTIHTIHSTVVSSFRMQWPYARKYHRTLLRLWQTISEQKTVLDSTT